MQLRMGPGSFPTWNHLTLVVFALGTFLGSVSTTYISNKKYDHIHKHDTGNDIIEEESRGGPMASIFKHDKDVKRYLGMFGKDAMLWRCKNAIQPYWNWKPLPVVELYCEAIGSMRDVKWFHNGKPLHLGHRYKLAIYPHHHDGHYFSTWIDFRLRIYNATHKDSGIYTFEVIGKHGSKNTQNVYVDISHKRRKRKANIWRDIYRRNRKETVYGAE